MEEQVSSTTVLINVLIQVANLVIFFLAFKYFLGDKIAKLLHNREILIKKLQKADTVYEEKITDAGLKADYMIQEGLRAKNDLIAEAGVLANKRKEEIIQEAQTQSDDLIKNAEKKIKKLEEDLENNFALGVKKTSMAVVKKLLATDKDIQSKYFDEIVKEATKK